MATLIKNIAEFKKIIGGVQRDMNEKTWMPFVEQGEQFFIAKEIGEDFYEELCLVESPSGKQKKLIDKLKVASGHYASMASSISMTLSMGDIGLAQNKTAGTENITKWQFVVKVKDARDKADKALEDALKYLEKNKKTFQTYIDSDEYKARQELLIPTASMLTDYIPVVDNSQIFYNRLKGYISKNQKHFLKPLIGSAQLETFKITARQEASSQTEEEKEALDLLRHAISNMALAEAIPFLSINADFRVVSETDGIINEGDLDAERKTGIQHKCLNEADKFTALLVKYLNKKASASVFSDFFNNPQVYKPTIKPTSIQSQSDQTGLAFLL